jgi:ABC-2 type transport system ATP-binding protein
MMNSTQDTAVVCEGLSKSFARRRSLAAALRHPLRRAGKIKALDGVDLAVRRGEIFGLLGPNGAGKTTLLKILSGLVLPDGGQARVDGADIARQEMAVRRAIGYVTSDERSFYWRLSGRQNLIFFARLFHVPAADIPRRVAELLQRVELTDKASEPFSAFSSGMKQRLAIARALLHAPPILFLDEPTRSLDPVTARHIRDFIRDKLSGEQGKTILLATHNLHEAASLCHRMAILNRGRVQRTGRLDEFRALFAAQRIYRVELDRPVDLDSAGRVLSSTRDEASGAITMEVQLHDQGDDALSRLVSSLAASGARVQEITRQEPPLEDLFDRLFHEDHGEEGR